MNFLQHVTSQLGFLLNCGFSVSISNPKNEIYDYVVNLQSKHIGIRIVYDRAQVLVDAGSTSMNIDQWFELTDIVRTYAPEINEVYNFPKTQLTFDNSVSIQLKRIAFLIKSYCMPFFLGDFSKIDEIEKVEQERGRELLKQLNSLKPKK